MPITQKRRSIDHGDPLDVPVQVSLRMPFWYRAQLQEVSPTISVAQIIMDAIERTYPPKRPRK